MNSAYKAALHKLVDKKKKEIPTVFSEAAVLNIFQILESTPVQIAAFAQNFDEVTSTQPIMEGKRSFRETLVHLLHIEGLNYTVIYPAFLLKKPTIYPIHAERDFGRLALYSDFTLSDLLQSFLLERRKTLNFLKSLKPGDWSKQIMEENKAREESIYWRVRELALHDFIHVKILAFQIGL